MSEAGDPALIGRRIAGKFVVEKFLGGGSMGAVYRARDDLLDRKVALKVMHRSVAVDPSFVSRFHREARAASRLDHPNSMHVIEFGEEPDGLLYIAMEYLEGRELYKVILEDWPLSEARIADIMMKALAAIAVAHDMGVIHRDLKPENIMILNRKDDEGQDIVKVCDFGIAKITEKDESAPDAPPKTAGAKLSTAGLVVGTPEYMSPEQARGEKLDARSDLYSMGIILYQLLTGRTPFLADTPLAVVLKHINDAPEPPSTIYPGVHKGLEAVCMRSLAKAKEERFQTARDMRAAIKAAIEGRPMPVDAHGATHAATGSRGHTSNAPGPHAAAASQQSDSTRPARAANLTPLGTAQEASEERSRSRVPMLLGIAVVALAVGAGAFVYIQNDQAATVEPTIPTASESARWANVSRPEVKPSAGLGSITPHPSRSSAPDSRTQRHATSPKSSSGPDTRTAPSAPTSEAPPSPPPDPTPDPQPTPSSAFNAASCRASVGAAKSVSGYNVKDFSIRSPESAWTSCVKSSILERPAAPITAAVRVRFNANKTFKAAMCNGCPPALAACVVSSTRALVSVNFKPGDAAGDPEFEVPVTFTCE